MSDESAAVRRVGVVGVGRLGAPLARRVAAAGYDVAVFDRRSDAVHDLVDTARVVTSSRDLAHESDVVAVCVADDEQALEVVTGVDGLLDGARAGTVLCVHGILHPSTCAVLARVAERQQVDLVDAPVFARAGTVEPSVVAVGGDARLFRRLLPYYRVLVDEVVNTGPVGSAMNTALVASMVAAAQRALELEAVGIGVDLGLDERVITAMLPGGAVSTIDPMSAKDVGIGRRVVQGDTTTESLLSAAAAKGVGQAVGVHRLSVSS